MINNLQIKKHGENYRAISDKANPIIEDLRNAIKTVKIKHLIEDYNALNERDKGTLDKTDVRSLVQCLHYSIRRERQSAANQRRQSGVRQLVEFAEKFVQDVKKGLLVPSGKANVHLIGIFKESGAREKGLQFWKWLQEQNEQYLDVDCYGAAIELLAVDGAPLKQLEELYQTALTQFPGNFAAYHLSPSAVLPDREKPFTVGGIPISLLQGIMTARLLNGDTRNAYLALDTALRLLPDQVPQRCFYIFMEERPLEEAYTVFALACRAGNPISSPFYRSMLSTLRSSTALASPAQHAIAVRAMLSITHLFIGAGGPVASNSVNELVIATTQFLRVKGVEALPTTDKKLLADRVMSLIHGISSLFARYGATPTIPAFNSIITNLGGFGHSRETISHALKEADSLGLAPTDVTWRSILSVAGMFHDRAFVESTWAHLRDSRIEAGENPTASDFHALVKPAHLSGAVEFALQEVERFRDVVGVEAYEGVAVRLEDPAEGEAHAVTNASEAVDMEAMMAELGKVEADIEVIKTRTEGAPSLQDFSAQALPMTLLPPPPARVDEAEMVRIYDGMTTEISSRIQTLSSSTESTTEVTKSKTGIPFATLRYENWKLLNYLLDLSEKNDRVYMKRVDEAIAKGIVAPKRTRVALGGEVEGSFGLSGVAAAVHEEREGEAGEEVEKARENILRLRGRR